MKLAILQARVSSSRLPGKVLKPILGMPMLLRQIERVRRCKEIDKLLVATSQDGSDDPIQALCEDNGVTYYRGDLADVLDRFYQAAVIHRPEHVIRLTGDCPLADPQVIDSVIEYHLAGQFDYTSNVLKPTFPDGLDVEVFRFACLERAWREAHIPSQREHVTSFIYNNPELFKLGSYENDMDLTHQRWTVDEPADYELVQKIYTALYPQNPSFITKDILALLQQQPELLKLNDAFQRNEGYLKSLQQDAASLLQK